MKKIKKILLISPRYTLYKNDVRRCLPPIGLAYIAGTLEKNGYMVKILDIAAEGYNNILKTDKNFITYGLDDEEIIKRITNFRPDLVGVSCIFSTQYQNFKKVLKIVKKINKNIITVAGGSHPTFSPKETLKNNDLDFIVMGEGELTMLKLLDTLNKVEGDISKIEGICFKKNGRLHFNKNLQYLQNIDDLSFPAYHLLNMETYFNINLPHNPYPEGKRIGQILTSRGCPALCVFCTSTNFWGNRYRQRSAKNVINEIKTLIKNYKIDEIQFIDDNLTLTKGRAIEIFNYLKRTKLKWCLPNGVAVWTLSEDLLHKMKESGCYQLSFAIESGNQKILTNVIKKPLDLKMVKPLVTEAKKIGIKIHGFFMCGLPGETIKQMHETYEFAKKCNFDSASFFVATPLIGSELLSICKKNNYLSNDFDGTKIYYKIGNVTTPEFKAKEVQELVFNFNKEYNKLDTRKKRFEKEKY